MQNHSFALYHLLLGNFCVSECAGYKENGSSKGKVVCKENEESTLQTFINIINHPRSKNARFIHYKGMGFDIPFLIIRAAHYGIEISNWNFQDLR